MTLFGQIHIVGDHGQAVPQGDEGGRFPFDKLIETFPIDRINEALTGHRQGRGRRTRPVPALL